MKQPALLLLLPVLLLGCRDQNAKTDASTDAAKTETTSPDAAKTDAAQTDTAKTDEKGDLNKVFDPPAENAEAATAKPGPLPKGYTRVPEVSKTPQRTFGKAPAFALEDGKDYAAVIDTTKGQIVVDLFDDVPTTVNNFVFLARRHFYDGILFHRVIDGFMAQTGDPQGTGAGGPGYQFADEIRKKYTFDGEGILAMANSGPNTNGSQFFITFGPTDFLNGRHTIFGKVVQGQDVLAKLSRTAKSDPSSGEQPIAGVKPDKMLDVYIVTKN